MVRTDTTRLRYERKFGRCSSHCTDEEWGSITPFLPRSKTTGRKSYPWLRHIFADGGCAGTQLKKALCKMECRTMEIVKRSDKARGFEVIPRRWVVERTFAWLRRFRRLAKDWEKSILSAKSWLLVAHIKMVIRRITGHCY